MARRCYTIEQLLSVDMLNMARRTFYDLRRASKLPFLVELKPRLGRVIRYRAEPVDQWLDGQWNQPRAFSSARRLSARRKQ